ncbi:rCG47362 [Rattus norvegicus]|uniref:RCG47362 n=1 Tax=Rattus norvegicus TaxID=10116 RepID=A6HWZ4_RAT|nr:rCG47362 [Rattus norvegicus]
MWEAITPLSDAVQEGQGFLVCIMTGNRVAMVGRLSLFSTKRPKLQRRVC